MSYKVYNIKLHSQYQEDNFHLLKSDLIDYWRKPSLKHNVVGKAMVPPSHFDWFEGQLEKLGVDRDIFVEDVYEYLIAKDTSRRQSSRNITDIENDFDIYNYNRYDEILDYITELEYKYINSTQVSFSVVEAGETDEGRSLVYFKIKAANSSDEIPVAVVESGIIPREWITVPSALNIVEKLLNEDQRNLIENFEWIIIPVLNPDGYEYTHTNLRLWTKNRSIRSNLGLICPGVNINRNFDISWLVSDSSSSPCSHLYSGVDAFSEPEARFIKDILEEYGDRMRLYVSLQNSGASDGFVSYPWQYERAASGMFRQHHLLGLDMVKAINGTYKLDVGFSALGDRASGTSSDYAMEAGVLYTFNIDVPQSDDGVSIPVEEIIDVVEDVWRAVETAAVRLV
ncbi:carboxypeptidase B-like [Epargyreus clarus]|uniref:carboxypeptidase B-like n=1 Tax=Epargyreus clarus TaxID=520877 RepID=UPI003C2C345D